ncbi:helix-turn-helix transcriptional regulator [Wolbachia endosymbiont (group A) of Gymnosoma rotundatum]|uniref:helix-turn-helix transcriptional regulator n=1 Tax=Wolbachia endosymbiont (group A) of Gymnosoma rotundatum TaxID=2954016 RepID=UPI002226D294|nr:helix-turn-helix transcriptional regulator [Wolbachia endosymbiont (group A) of Gymnosoma rotundatum]
MTTTKNKIDPDSLCYQITQKAKDIRLKMGCSQIEFAKRAGVAKSTVINYELGVYSIEPTTLERMANKLYYDIDVFFPEPPEGLYISRENKQAFCLLQSLKRIKDLKVHEAVCTLTRFLSEGIKVNKAITEVRPIKSQMAQKAKDWRFIRGYTQVELADKAGLSRTQVNTYEREILSSFKHIPELAKGLSISFVVLLPTSKAESYCKDDNGQGENKIFHIMKEYKKIENTKIKDLWSSFLTKLIKICEKEEES